ncbi:DUF2461 domain-containing protein [Gordonia zhaorongruii]|uniref:DUF2461 domain-containing protein n=1 Tax=Gordonia zhaorongruii TaxID=2597659 RepID=UPI00104EAAF4|nr:DUF2461 domain-containing protein [Gordonia zhaorongruii]
MPFHGFPVAALDFYDDLEADNSKPFWEANKHIYTSSVAAPMNDLAEALSGEFGEPKVFRPYRDVRFSKDKTPYKTHQGLFFAHGPATGYYVQIGAPGVMVAAGFYHAETDRLAALRTAIDTEAHGKELERLLQKLTRSGWTVGGDTLKTAPRGWPKDHPRIELLRHKSLTVSRDYGFEDIVHSPELLDQIREHWRQATPLVDWAVAHG